MKVQKAYKVRIYPDKEQEQKLLQTIGACRFIYNYYLTLQINAYFQTGKNLPYAALATDLTKLRNSGQYPWLKEVQAQPLQQSLRVLDVAYNNFYRGRAQTPRFKSKNDGRQSFRKFQDWRFEDGKLWIQSDIIVCFRGRKIPTGVTRKTLTISKTATGKWYASIKVTEDIEVPTEHTTPIGIDLGLTHIAITSDGQKYDNPTVAKKQARSIKLLSQSLARKQKGSNRRQKAKLELARLHEKIANRRMNHLHQVSSAITGKNHTLIAVEGLSVVNMVKNHSLARSIGDVSWSELIRQIEYKQQWRGGQFVKVDRFFPSSKICSQCLHIMQDMPLSVREWHCPACGIRHDRDINAANNILKQAEVQLGAESTESKASDSPMVAGSVKRGHTYV
jgi:putative transposase